MAWCLHGGAAVVAQGRGEKQACGEQGFPKNPREPRFRQERTRVDDRSFARVRQGRHLITSQLLQPQMHFFGNFLGWWV